MSFKSRKKMKKSRSKKLFRKTASKVRSQNYWSGGLRGGIRL